MIIIFSSQEIICHKLETYKRKMLKPKNNKLTPFYKDNQNINDQSVALMELYLESEFILESTK